MRPAAFGVLPSAPRGKKTGGRGVGGFTSACSGVSWRWRYQSSLLLGRAGEKERGASLRETGRNLPKTSGQSYDLSPDLC